MKKTVKKSLALILAALMLVSCMGFSATAAESTGYEVTRINCTVYGDTKTQRGFNWYTDKNCGTTIEYLPASEYNASSANPFSNAYTKDGSSSEWDGKYCHKVILTGLEPGTKYYYRVGDAKTNSWSDVVGTFVTDNGDGKFSFIAIADVQASSYEKFEQAAKVMEAAMAKTPKAELVVNMGDFVNDCTSEEWTWFGDAFKAYNTNLTMAPVAGNHDGNITNKLNVGWFEKQFVLEKGAGDTNGINGTYYSFDYGNVHFCVLNTNDMYTMTEAQRNWAINDLNNTDAHWKVLLTHRAAYSHGKNINKPDTIALRETLIEIVDATGVDLVLSGHDHTYSRTYQLVGDAVVKNVKYKDVEVNETKASDDVVCQSVTNPDGAVYIVPSTAGTKRYGLNDTPIDPINECTNVKYSTKSQKVTDEVDGQEVTTETNEYAGGCFANITVNGNKLVYKAYVVNDDTNETKLLDYYEIKKTVADEKTESEELKTDIIATIDGTIYNTFTELVKTLVTYLTVLLPQWIKGLF
ncbi:MAG: metallophosphoesterase family protein [Oscillospiraceae bacterium]|nr:metallophosphoesterase family protein [Oscillospiraceae bacterium]